MSICKQEGYQERKSVTKEYLLTGGIPGDNQDLKSIYKQEEYQKIIRTQRVSVNRRDTRR